MYVKITTVVDTITIRFMWTVNNM